MLTRLTTALLSAAALALACATVSIAAAWAPINGARFDGRSPDTKDAALLAHQNRHLRRRATAGRAVFAGIGAAAGFGLATIAAAALALARSKTFAAS